MYISTAEEQRSRHEETAILFSDNKSNSLRSDRTDMPEVKATIKPAIPRSLPCLLNEDVSDSQTPRHVKGKVKRKRKRKSIRTKTEAAATPTPP